MKNIFLLVIFGYVLLPTISNSQTEEPKTPLSLKLKGNVKLMSESSYDVKGKWSDLEKLKIKSKEINYSYNFSEKQIIQLKAINRYKIESKDTLSTLQKDIYVYDEFGNLSKELQVVSYNDPVKTLDDWESNISLVEYYHTYIYKGGKLITKNHVNSKENIDHVERQYYYDSKNNLIMIKYLSHSSKDSTVIKKEVFNYNAEGWKEEYILYSMNDVENERIKYNSKGLVVYKKYTYSSLSGKQFTETTYTYNEKEQKIGEENTETTDGVLKYINKITCAYNEKGDLSESSSIYKDSKPNNWKYIYKYDSNDNWINCYTYNTAVKEVYSFTRRVITYY